MASSITLKETINVGRSGKYANFSIGRPSTSQRGPEPDIPYIFMGFRENVDPEKLIPYQQRWAHLKVGLWESKAEVIAKVCSSFLEKFKKGINWYLSEELDENIHRARATIDTLQKEPFAELKFQDGFLGGICAPDVIWDNTGLGKIVQELIVDPEFKEAWIQALEIASLSYLEWYEEALKKYELSPKQGQLVVTFSASREGGPMTRTWGKVSFPDRNGPQPKIGEKWIVEKSGESKNGNVNFLKLIRRVSDEEGL